MSAEYICVYPLTSTYSTLPRLNTSILLIFICFGAADTWVMKGALAATMTRTSIIAFHAFSLLAVLPDEHSNSVRTTLAFDLNIQGAWSLLGAVGCAMPLLLGWAPSLRDSKARPLARVWGILCIAGAACCYAAMVRAQSFTFNADSISAVSRCEASQVLRMRSKSEVTSLPSAEAFDYAHRSLFDAWDKAALVMMAFGGWACLRLGRVGHTVLQGVAADTVKDAVYVDPEPSFKAGVAFLEQAATVASAIIFSGFVVIWERRFIQDGVPELEQITAFEQWSCWVATGLVIGATVLNWGLQKLRPAQKSNENVTWTSLEDGLPVDIETNPDIKW